MSIERYRLEDRDAVEAILTEDVFVQQDMLACLEQFGGCAYVMHQEGVVAGVSVFTGQGPRSSLSLLIAPHMRRQGLGSRLLCYTLQTMKSAGVCEVFCDFLTEGYRRAFMEPHGFSLHFRSWFMTRPCAAFPRHPAIAPYKAADYEQAAAIEHGAFHRMRVQAGIHGSRLSELSEEERHAYNTNAQNRFVWREGDNIVATLQLDGCEIDTVAVDITRQRQGYGRQMVCFALDELRARGYEHATLWCVDGNPARYLYERLGFTTERLHDFMLLCFREFI